MDIAVYAKVLRDLPNKKGIKGGETTHTAEGDIRSRSGKPWVWAPPGFRYMNPKTKIVTEIIGLARLHFTVKIQTFYGPGVDPAHDSMYGRGTTPADKEAGNTSLGFHESCHRKDFVDYLRKTPLPVFDGKLGTTESEFIRAGDAWGVAIDKYLAGMDKYSARQTDEVGYKESEYDSKKGQRP